VEKIRIGISACLLGEKVRYDGEHKQDHYLTDTLASYIDWLPVCPESECGLSTPREVMHLVGDRLAPRLRTVHSGLDHTDRISLWAKSKLNDLVHAGLCGFVFKARSPSCSLHGVRVHADPGTSGGSARGLFAEAFIRYFPLMPVEEENRLYDPAVRESFYSRVFTFKRWLELSEKDSSFKALIEFHTHHKFLILSHSPRHYASLGRLLASPGPYPDHIHREYIPSVMEALTLKPTISKQTNVLQHMAGYFRKRLPPDEKQEMREAIERYRDGLVPLVMPLCLIRHQARIHKESYLMAQLYLFPDPLELMLRNHA
jgi:uncharacterized protein YbgA (DUF1722 family)/uncharacterized protein YbbK (DUF523 family)